MNFTQFFISTFIIIIFIFISIENHIGVCLGLVCIRVYDNNYALRRRKRFFRSNQEIGSYFSRFYVKKYFLSVACIKSFLCDDVFFLLLSRNY